MTSAVNRRHGWHLMPGEKDGEEGLQFDNSGSGPLRVPGFGGLPLNIERRPAERFAHGSHDWAQPRITAREAAMLRLMNQLTDIPAWHTLVTDDIAVTGLRPAPEDAPLISDAAWAWCVAELRDKAEIFKETGQVAVYDSASSLVKSDVLISGGLLSKLQAQIESLISEGGVGAVPPDLSSGNGEPDANAPILHLVDPAMYPLVYGETKVLSNGGQAGLEGALDAIGSGQTAPEQALGLMSADVLLGDEGLLELTLNGGLTSRLYRWSAHSQWLPCEVAFSGDGEAGTPDDVTIASYINNLHPIFHNSMYSTIGKVISLSIRPWNGVLAWRDRYRRAPRIRTYGVSWMPPFPEWAYRLRWLELVRVQQLRREEARRLLQPRAHSRSAFSPDQRQELEREYEESEAKAWAYLANPVPKAGALQTWPENKTLLEAVRHRHNDIKTGWAHPEPGVSFSCEDWKVGRSSRAIVPNGSINPWKANGDGPISEIIDEHDFYEKVSLRDTFRDQGLQVIVRLTTIELTPEQPRYEVEGLDWDIGDGLLNEHIVATTIVCLSSVNVSPYTLLLRVEADMYANEYHYEEYRLDELAATFDVAGPPDDLNDNHSGGGGDGSAGAALDAELDALSPALQVLGAVTIPQGRLLAVPAVMQRRLHRPLELLDRARPGHVRLLTLHLVDPHYRVCSTRNVPPQQHAWWAAAAGVGRIDWPRWRVPPEVADLILRDVGEEFPMAEAEAQRVRRERALEERLARIVAELGVGAYAF